jgi:hypothetical protein
VTYAIGGTAIGWAERYFRLLRSLLDDPDALRSASD